MSFWYLNAIVCECRAFILASEFDLEDGDVDMQQTFLDVARQKGWVINLDAHQIESDDDLSTSGICPKCAEHYNK